MQVQSTKYKDDMKIRSKSVVNDIEISQ